MALVLTRRVDESICIGNDILVTLIRIDRNRVRLAIEAPRNIAIYREELLPKQCSNHGCNDKAALGKTLCPVCQSLADELEF